MNKGYFYFNDFRMDLNKDPHYKLYVQLRESIVFDAALNEAKIDFIKEENPIGEEIRYYFKDKDSPKVDSINKDLRLSISTETMPALDHFKNRKEVILYILIIFFIVIFIGIFSFV